jgi:predicted branched-subunit amino acid permease
VRSPDNVHDVRSPGYGFDPAGPILALTMTRSGSERDRWALRIRVALFSFYVIAIVVAFVVGRPIVSFVLLGFAVLNLCLIVLMLRGRRHPHDQL